VPSSNTQYESKAFERSWFLQSAVGATQLDEELQRKQVCLLPKRGHQSRPLPHTT
jgi:hypothetical protein